MVENKFISDNRFISSEKSKAIQSFINVQKASVERNVNKHGHLLSRLNNEQTGISLVAISAKTYLGVIVR